MTPLGSDTDDEPLALGQVEIEPGTIRGGTSIDVTFRTREPEGTIDTLTLDEGQLRQMQLFDNILFTAALEGGITAWDVTKSFNEATPLGFARESGDAYYAVEIDRHGRVWATGLGATFGFLHGWHVSDFVDGTPPIEVRPARSSALVSWAPGGSGQLDPGLFSTSIPEGIPRTIEVLTQDDIEAYDVEGIRALSGGNAFDLGAGWTRFEINLPRSDEKYALQAITIENVTRGMRWHGMATSDVDAHFPSVLALDGDELRIIHNRRTWGLVTIFGFGIGVWDLNAVEEHDSGLAIIAHKEKLLLTSAEGDAREACKTASFTTEGIESLQFSPGVEIIPSTVSALLNFYGVEVRDGVIDLSIDPSSNVESVCFARGPGLMLRSQPVVGWITNEIGGTGPRFGAPDRYSWSIEGADNAPVAPASSPLEQPRGRRGSIAGQTATREYILVPARTHGLMVVEVAGTNRDREMEAAEYLADRHLVDIIWIPTGAWSVRNVPGSDLAVVIDGRGHALLVDLTRIDERWTDAGDYRSPNEIFPTLADVLAGEASPWAGGIGLPDPRIVWRSERPVTTTTLPPVVDPVTGAVYAGNTTENTIERIAVERTRLHVAVDIGQGTTSETGGIVPLGVDPPVGILACNPGESTSEGPCNASLGAFRVEAMVPAWQAEAAGNAIHVRVRSEIVPGSPVEAPEDETLPPVERTVLLRRDLPPGIAATLRHQRAWNRFVSDWIVGVADPRASKDWTWLGEETAESEGCASCVRPARLEGLGESDSVWEIWTAGRLLDLSLVDVAGTEIPEVVGIRVPVTPADLVLPKGSAISAQTPPIASGELQGTVYLHSGEVATGTVDLVVGGRAGFDVLVDRSWRSHLLGRSPLGYGWSSSLFRRLRALPSGNVEYRDGGGNIWTFTAPAKSQEPYGPPAGLFLQLYRTDRGWELYDQAGRLVRFDAYGRLTSESDLFHDPTRPESGNVIHYLYDRSGRLVRIVDSVNRATAVEYWPAGSGSKTGLLWRLTDWRGREVEYDYDGLGRLIEVRLPEVASAGGVPPEYSHTGSGRPKIRYTYQDNAGAYRGKLEIASNLVSITDPREVETSGEARVEWNYALEPAFRDRVTSERWPCGSIDESGECGAATATFDWSSSTPSVTDVLGQVREFTLVTAADGFSHVGQVVEEDVPTLTFDPDALPDEVTAGLTPANEPLTTQWTDFDEFGQPRTIVLPSGTTIANTFDAAPTRQGSVGNRLEKSVIGTGDEAITTEIKYEASSSAMTIPSAVKRGGVEREVSQGFRDKLVVERTDVDVVHRAKYDARGQVITQETLDKNGTTKESTRIARFSDDYSTLISRGLVSDLVRGVDVSRNVTFSYTPTEQGGIDEVVRDGEIGSTTITRRDSWDRPIERIVLDSAGRTLVHELSGFDETGRLAYLARKQEGLDFVVETYTYDPHGRIIETRLDNASVGDEASATLVTTSLHDLTARRTTEVYPHLESEAASAPRRVTQLDNLGRPIRIEESAPSFSQKIVQVMAWDVHGGPSYSTDTVRSAEITARDSLGRAVRTKRSDGVTSTTSWNDWSEPVFSATAAPIIDPNTPAEVTSREQRIYTDKGRLRAVNQELSTFGEVRQTYFSWTDGDRTAGTRLGRAAGLEASEITGESRFSETTVDSAGRFLSSQSGAAVGSTGSLGAIFAKQEATAWRGDQPIAITMTEPLADASYESRTEYDDLGRPVRMTEGVGTEVYATEIAYDEASNVLSFTAPGLSPATTKYDSRGLTIESTHPDAASIRSQYDALGNLTKYVDELNQETTYIYDGLGRITVVQYPDTTSEETRYEDVTGLVHATRNRAGTWLRYVYDDASRVVEIRQGATLETANALFETLEYDSGGRLVKVMNQNAACEYGDFDLLGRPRTTRTWRYANDSGFQADPEVLDVHMQKHVWSVFDGERERWSMPIAGDGDIPEDPSSPWRNWIVETRDGAGNLVRQSEASSINADPDAFRISNADSRGIGRLESRYRNTASGDLVSAHYGFMDGRAGSPAGVVSGLLGEVETRFSGYSVAGSRITRDATKRTATASHYGLEDRTSLWQYDPRGRLESAEIGKLEGSTRVPLINETFDPADFRVGRTVAGRLSPPDRQELGTTSYAVEPANWTATPTNAHQIDARSLSLDPLDPIARDYEFVDGRRASDGVWATSYDAKDRLVEIASSTRRILYTYDPMDRVVGRDVEVRTDPNSPWFSENRLTAIQRDGLPPRATFVWDPMVDRLVAIFETGASQGATVTATSGLVAQFVHGDQSYDDPLEVQASLQPGGVPTRYLPIVDEASGGSVVAVLDGDGYLAERVIYADSYGDQPRFVHGPLVDRMTIEATKDGEGSIEEVRVEFHLSESIDEATLEGNVRITSVSGEVVDGAPIEIEIAVTPTLTGGDTIVFVLSGEEWSTVADGSAAIKVSVTDGLRSPLWGDAPVMTMPSWVGTLRGVESTSATPFVKHESVASLAQFFDTIGAGQTSETTTWDLPDLYLVASTESKSKILTGFKAAPFIDPVTGLAYFRARWYDPSTGTFLSPDPLGYQDSSNLYAFCGGDPVNCSDPRGEESMGELVHGWSENAFYSGNWLAIGGAVLGESVYALFEVASIGAVGKIDSAQEQLDRHQITRASYWRKTGGAVAQTVASYTGGLVAARLAGAGAATALGSRAATVSGARIVGTSAGSAGSLGGLFASDAVGVITGTQEHFSSPISYMSAATIGALGGVGARPSVPRGAISDVGSRIQGNQAVFRIAQEVEGAVNQANRILATGGTGGTRWGNIYQRSIGWFGDTRVTRMARGWAVQQITDDLLRNNVYMREAGVIFNRGSALGLRSPSGRLLRPDYQVPLPGGRWGIIDITTHGQVRKIFNYSHPLAPYLVNVTHGF